MDLQSLTDFANFNFTIENQLILFVIVVILGVIAHFGFIVTYLMMKEKLKEMQKN
jgi:hypothetical protein